MWGRRRTGLGRPLVALSALSLRLETRTWASRGDLGVRAKGANLSELEWRSIVGFKLPNRRAGQAHLLLPTDQPSQVRTCPRGENLGSFRVVRGFRRALNGAPQKGFGKRCATRQDLSVQQCSYGSASFGLRGFPGVVLASPKGSWRFRLPCDS